MGGWYVRPKLEEQSDAAPVQSPHVAWLGHLCRPERGEVVLAMNPL